MYRSFRFGVVIANTPSRTAFIALARRAEQLGYATLLMPDRTITGLAPLIRSCEQRDTPGFRDHLESAACKETEDVLSRRNPERSVIDLAVEINTAQFVACLVPLASIL